MKSTSLNKNLLLILILNLGLLIFVFFDLKTSFNTLSHKIGSVQTDISGLEQQIGILSIIQTNDLPPASEGGREFFIDPLNGSSNGDGTMGSPWMSLQDIVDAGYIESQNWNTRHYTPNSSYLIDKNYGAPIKSGDIIYLMTGDYGDIKIIGYYNKKPITVAAYPGEKPVVNSIKVVGGSNWIFRNLSHKYNQITPFRTLPLDIFGPNYGVSFETVSE